MIKINELTKKLETGAFDETIQRLYVCKKEECQRYAERFSQLTKSYIGCFGEVDEIGLFSAPGRTEIGGNHTDHQHGAVLAASVNLDVIAAAAPNGTNIIRIQSEGYPLDEVSLDDLSPQKEEENQSKALIRGIAARFSQMGYKVGGFDAYTTSNVLKGSGLSSSAAFEVLVGVIMNHLYCDGQISDVEIAKIGQYSENVYFGKPSGLMDQMASSVGGVVSIDFEDTEKPRVKKIEFDFPKAKHSLCIIDSGADHADLTPEYAAIPQEMKAIATFFGKEYLRQVKKSDVMENIDKLRKKLGDRAVLRAIHFYNDHERAIAEAEALRKGDFEAFLGIAKESGFSSYMYLQNVNVKGATDKQPVGLVLALCDELLGGRGAFRVHGGGFAGTVQAFVPIDMLDEFKAKMEAAIGSNCCHVLSIRPVGGICIA